MATETRKGLLRLPSWPKSDPDLELHTVMMCLASSASLPQSAVTPAVCAWPHVPVLPSLSPPPEVHSTLLAPRQAWDWPSRPPIPLSQEQSIVSHNALRTNWSSEELPDPTCSPQRGRSARNTHCWPHRAGVDVKPGSPCKCPH